MGTASIRAPESDAPQPPHRSRVVDQPGGNVALDLFVVSQHLGALLDRAFDGTGITPSQYAVYSQLGQRTMTPRQLTEILGVRPTTLSGYLATMERRGHVWRQRHESDGRSTWLGLTAPGREQMEACRARMRAAVRVLNAQLGGAAAVDAMRDQLALLDHALVAAGRQFAQ